MSGICRLTGVSHLIFLLCIVFGTAVAGAADEEASSGKILLPDGSDPKSEGTPVPLHVRSDMTPEMAQRADWWREARFGMFIHWGVYSMFAGSHGDSDTYGEWILRDAGIPAAEYEAMAAEFNPTRFDPDEWVRIALDAGMKYIILTTKHHDGFALFDSKLTEYDVVDHSKYGRDLVKQLAEATHAAGLRFGVYYSQTDWHHPDFSEYWHGYHSRPSENPDMDRYVEFMQGQIRELLTNYGQVDVVWFDGGGALLTEGLELGDFEYHYQSAPEHFRSKETEELIHSLQPNALINDRLGGDTADFTTPEQFVPVPGSDWTQQSFEVCMTINRSWGYNRHNVAWKSSKELIRNLIDIASSGGNFLLNVGPTAEGEIPPDEQVALEGVGRWLRRNGASIYGAERYDGPSVDWGRVTQRSLPGGDTRLYLHVFDWPERHGISEVTLRLPDVANRPLRANGLDAESRVFQSEETDSGIEITLTGPVLDAVSSTIVLDLEGPLMLKGTTFPAPACDTHRFTESVGTYDFAGELGSAFEDRPEWQDHPTPGVINDAVFLQRNGRLEFEVPSASMAASEAWKTWGSQMPSDESWKVRGSLDLPLSWNSGEDEEHQIGIGLWVGKPGGTTVYEIDFLAVASGERAILAQNIHDRHGGDPNYVPREVDAITTTVELEILYCAEDRSLSVFYDNGVRVDTQPVDDRGLFDWEIGQVFDVGVIGFAEGPSATAEFPSIGGFEVLVQESSGSDRLERPKLAFFSDRDGNHEIYTMDFSGANLVRLTDNPAEDSYPSWSPDGSRLIFESDRDGDFEIYTMKADGTDVLRLTDNDADDLSSSWSPDGKQITFVSFRDGETSEVYLMNADGSEEQRLTHNEFDDEGPHFSPDGKKIATESGDGPRRQIYVMNVDGSDHVPLMDRDAYHGYPTWSPDGSKIAFDSTMEGDPRIFVMNADGSGAERLTQGEGTHLFANWSRDGRRILYVSLQGEDKGDLFIVDLETRETTRLTDSLEVEAAPSCFGF